METRFFHGDIDIQDMANALIAHFHQRGDLRVQQVGKGDRIVVQIATKARPASGGTTALSVSLQEMTDGVAVQIGQQEWLGLAADLGKTALAAWRNPWSLLHRLDDLAQDLNLLQLSDLVWEVIESTARSLSASTALEERLRGVVCPYCGTLNPIGAGQCDACGAPLGNFQPRTCPRCGFVLRAAETVCPNCDLKLPL